MKKKSKIHVLILFGGKSAEHEVSVKSAKFVVNSLNTKKYKVTLIGISKNGEWALFSKEEFHLLESVVITRRNKSKLSGIISIIEKQKPDIAFPILHGPNGEDGTIQGFFKTINIPHVGADVIGSAVGMDKDIMKRLLRDCQLPIADFIVFRKEALGLINFKDIKKKLGVPFFVKPANLGSSVGITKVACEADLKTSLSHAFSFDKKILIEKYVPGREIECAIIGTKNPKASICGEIISRHDFYSYDAKYIDKKGSELLIPAPINKTIEQRIKELAIKTFEVLECRDFARVDFFLTSDNKIYINEINTIPGFTPSSMFPKLWQQCGINSEDLVDELISLALESKP